MLPYELNISKVTTAVLVLGNTELDIDENKCIFIECINLSDFQVDLIS